MMQGTDKKNSNIFKNEKKKTWNVPTWNDHKNPMSRDINLLLEGKEKKNNKV